MWGAVQDTSQLGYFYNGQPFLMTNEVAASGVYNYDNHGRLVQITSLPQGSITNFTFDPVGNRTGVATSPGLGGL